MSEFEKWAKKQGLDISRDNHPNPRGLYWYGNTQAFWECWQAAHAAAREQAENIAGSVNNSSGYERTHNLPGGDAMGAVIEYRDRIRAMQP